MAAFFFTVFSDSLFDIPPTARTANILLERLLLSTPGAVSLYYSLEMRRLTVYSSS